MSKRRALSSFFVSGLLWAATARADFKLRDGSAVPTAGNVATPAPVSREDIRSPATTPTAEPQQRVVIARGFGHRVPLAFAVRQIVPPNIAVDYANDVDRTAPVNWAGGGAWNRVLARSVAPLGLHITLGAREVTIFR